MTFGRLRKKNKKTIRMPWRLDYGTAVRGSHLPNIRMILMLQSIRNISNNNGTILN